MAAHTLGWVMFGMMLTIGFFLGILAGQFTGLWLVSIATGLALAVLVAGALETYLLNRGEDAGEAHRSRFD